jgi:hypothetical protein
MHPGAPPPSPQKTAWSDGERYELAEKLIDDQKITVSELQKTFTNKTAAQIGCMRSKAVKKMTKASDGQLIPIGGYSLIFSFFSFIFSINFQSFLIMSIT